MKSGLKHIKILPDDTIRYRNVDYMLAEYKARVLTHSSYINTHIDEIFDDLKESLYEEIDEIRVYSSYLDEIHRIQHLAEERAGRISDKL